MAIGAPIPMPQNSMDAFMSGMANSQAIFDSLAKNKLTAAQTKREAKLAELPFGGMSLPGPAGQVQALEMMKGLYGENSPQYHQALNAFNLGQNSDQSRIDYQNKLSKSMPIRYTTPQGRAIIEQSNVSQGYSPAGTPQGQVIAPGAAPYHEPGAPYFNTPGVAASQPQAGNMSQSNAPMQDMSAPPQQAPNANSPALSQYNMKQLKNNVPAPVLAKDLYATNIEKTIDSINLDDLTQYNGPKGFIMLKNDEAANALGNPPERYLKYLDAEKKFNFLPNQIRQFYGDSIQPSAMEEKLKKLDPRGVLNSATAGKRSFEAQKSLLNKELKTYRDATQGTEVYKGQEETVTPHYSEGKAAPSGYKWMTNPQTNEIEAVHDDWVDEMRDKYGFAEVE